MKIINKYKEINFDIIKNLRNIKKQEQKTTKVKSIKIIKINAFDEITIKSYF